MSQLLQDWINNEVVLSHHIRSLESDLRNGYLLGELLYRHNQLHSFHRFMNNASADAQINNFCLVEPVLRAMGIRFDAQTAYGVMKGKPGAASTILYKVKMVLDRLKELAARETAAGTGPDQQELLGGASSGGQVLPLPNMPVRLSKPQFDRASQLMFESAVRQLVDNHTEVMIADHLRPFAEAGVRFEQRLESGKLDALAEQKQQDAAVRNTRLYEQQQHAAFMRAFDQRGLEVWTENQDRAKARLQVRRNILVKHESTRHAKAEQNRSAAQAIVSDGITDFEARLNLTNTMLLQGSQPSPAPGSAGSGPGLALQVLPPPPSMSASSFEFEAAAVAVLDSGTRSRDMHAQVSEMRSRKFVSEHESATREKRRRRFITEREVAQVAEYHSRAADHLQQQLSRACLAEETMHQTLTLVTQHHGVMAENRQFRAQQYKQRADVDLEEALRRDNACLEQANQVYASELSAQATRHGMAVQARGMAQRTRNSELCKDVLYRVVDLALEVVAYRRFAQPLRPKLDTPPSEDCPNPASASLLPPLVWQDMKRVFVKSGLPLLALDGELTCHPNPTRQWGVSSALKTRNVNLSSSHLSALALASSSPLSPFSALGQQQNSNRNSANSNNDNSNNGDDNGSSVQQVLANPGVGGGSYATAVSFSSNGVGGKSSDGQAAGGPAQGTSSHNAQSTRARGKKGKSVFDRMSNLVSGDGEVKAAEATAAAESPVAGEAAAAAEAETQAKAQAKLSSQPNDPPSVEAASASATNEVASYLDSVDVQDYLANLFPWNDDALQSLTEKGMAAQVEAVQQSQAEQQLERPGSELGAGMGKDDNRPAHGSSSSSPSPSSMVVGSVAPFFALGEVVVATRLMAKPLPPPKLPPKVPLFDLTVVFCGKSFTGKTEQAYLLSERYRLKPINAEKELSKALKLAKEFSMGSISEQELESARPTTQRLVALGHQAHKVLLARGGVVPDSIYARLVVNAIHRTAEENEALLLKTTAAGGGGLGLSEAGELETAVVGGEDPAAVQGALLRVSSDESTGLGEDGDKAGGDKPKKGLKSNETVKDRAGFGHVDVPTKLWCGWVVEDFPETALQAKLFEKLLSGYDSSSVEPTRWDHESVLCKACPKGPDDPGRWLGTSGIDLVLYLSAERECVLRRSLGRRLDPETSRVYHLDTNRPPYDLVCKERMVSPIDGANPSETLSLQLAAHDLQSTELLASFYKFGNVRRLDSTSLSPQGLFAATVTLIADVIQAKHDLVANAASGNNGGTGGGGIDNHHRPAAAAFGADTNGEGAVAAAAAAGAAAAEGALAVDETAVAGGAIESAATPEAVPLEAALGTAQAATSLQLPLPLALVMVEFWDALEADVLRNLKRAMRALREERLFTTRRLRDVKVSFMEFLTRPDDRNAKVLSPFIAAFNQVPNDLRFHPLTKRELRLRCEELQLSLWACSEEKEVAAFARLNHHQTQQPTAHSTHSAHSAHSAPHAGSLLDLGSGFRWDGFKQQRVQAVERTFALLMQIEVDRFTGSLHLLLDHTAALTGHSPLPEGLLAPLCELGEFSDAAGGHSSGGLAAVLATTTTTRPAPPVDVLGSADFGHDSASTSKAHSNHNKSAQVAAALAGHEEEAAAPSEAAETSAPPSPTPAAAADATAKAAAKGAGSGGQGGALGCVAAAAVAALSRWLPDKFVVVAAEAGSHEDQLEEQSNKSGAGGGGELEGGGGSSPFIHPPPKVLHEAVWVQAELATKRIQRLLRKGNAAKKAVSQEVEHAYREMEGWVKARVTSELEAGEVVVEACESAVDSEEPLSADWLLQGGSAAASGTFLLVQPRPPPPEPKVPPTYPVRFNQLQHQTVSRALAAAAAAEGFADVVLASPQPTATSTAAAEGGGASASSAAALRDATGALPFPPPPEHNTLGGGGEGDGVGGKSGGVVSTGVLVDVLMRLAASDSDLPAYWSGQPAAEGFSNVVAALDPNRLGFVATKDVAEFFQHSHHHLNAN